MTVPDTVAQPLSGTSLAPAGSQLVLAEWGAPGNPREEPLYQSPPLHKHSEEDEAWYVLEGRLRVRVGEQVHDITAGGAVIVPAETPHTFWNPSPEPVRYIMVMGAQTAALIKAIHATDDRSPDRMQQIYAAHGATLLA